MPPCDTSVRVRGSLLSLHRLRASPLHSGRKLTWVWNQSRNELRTTYTSTKYTLATSSYQATILLQYNGGSDSLSFEDLQAGTQISEDVLKPQLALLVKQKILTQDDDTYDLNLDYKSKKVCGRSCRPLHDPRQLGAWLWLIGLPGVPV